MSYIGNKYVFVVQIFPVIAALFGANSTPAFAFFKFVQVVTLLMKSVASLGLVSPDAVTDEVVMPPYFW